MCYQPNECYLFSHLRNIIVPEIYWTQTLEACSKNGRAFPTFWQMTCPNHIFSLDFMPKI